MRALDDRAFDKGVPRGGFSRGGTAEWKFAPISILSRALPSYSPIVSQSELGMLAALGVSRTTKYFAQRIVISSVTYLPNNKNVCLQNCIFSPYSSIVRLARHFLRVDITFATLVLYLITV